MTTTTRACLLAAALLAGTPIAVAQTLPGHGMSMADVQRTFGAPVRDLGAVGSPAITRWVYDGFTVYFEGRRVINSVQTMPLESAAPAYAAPAPAPAPVTAPVARAPEPASAPVARPAEWPAKPATVEVPAPASARWTPPAPVVAPPPAAPWPPATPATVKPMPFTAAPAAAISPTPAAPAPATTPRPTTKSGSGFSFDPETGRLVLDSEVDAAPAAGTTAPAQTAPTSEGDDEGVPARTAPGSESDSETAGDVGTADDQTLEFDPETGTFRAR